MSNHLFAPDMQLPFVNRRQVRALSHFVKAKKRDGYIDKVHQVGDLVDYTSFGRWVKNQRGEYDTDLRKHIDDAKHLLTQLQVDHYKRGNHDERLDKYVEINAPALSPLVWDRGALSMEALFDLDNLGVKYEREIYEFAPGLACAHGDESGISGTPGLTALKLAKKIGKAVVCGHSHRAAIIPDTESFQGRPERMLFGMEVGNFMVMSQASYLKGQYANWQSAFGIVETSNSRAQPYLIFVSQTGSFSFMGESWNDAGYVKKGSTK